MVALGVRVTLCQVFMLRVFGQSVLRRSVGGSACQRLGIQIVRGPGMGASESLYLCLWVTARFSHFLVSFGPQTRFEHW